MWPSHPEGRGCRCSSHGRPQGCPPSRHGAEWGTPSGSAVATCLHAAARTRRAARAVQSDVVSVWQVLPRTPSAPPMPAQRGARFDDYCIRNCLRKNKLRQRYSKYSITPSQEVGRIPPRQQRVGSDEAICACNAGGGFCAVRQAQLSAHPFGCSRGKPWGHLSTCGESDKPAQALGGVGRFQCSHLWGGLGEGWQCHQDRPSQLGSALWRHLPGQERTEVRWALAAMVRTGL